MNGAPDVAAMAESVDESVDEVVGEFVGVAELGIKVTFVRMLFCVMCCEMVGIYIG